MIGLVDSGADDDRRIVDARAFALAEDGTVASCPAAADALGHGSSIAATILAAAPAATLALAQVFRDSMTTSPALVAAALGWLASRGVRLANLSFGLARDRDVLREACATASAAGMVLVAASPARGPRVFPAAYDGVIRASGDARCAAGEISVLAADAPLFGACPRTLDDRVRGASAAAAHVTGVLGAWMLTRPDAGLDAALAHLRSVAAHHGREHRVR